MAKNFSEWRGEVDAKLDRVILDLEEERRSSEKHRYALKEVLAAQSMALNSLTATVERITPTVDRYRDEASERKGMAKVINIIWAFIVAMSSAVGVYIGKRWG